MFMGRFFRFWCYSFGFNMWRFRVRKGNTVFVKRVWGFVFDEMFWVIISFIVDGEFIRGGLYGVDEGRVSGDRGRIEMLF